MSRAVLQVVPGAHPARPVECAHTLTQQGAWETPVDPPGHPWSQRLDTFWGFPPFLALVEAVTVAVHLQDMDMMGQAIEKCPGEAFGGTS